MVIPMYTPTEDAKAPPTRREGTPYDDDDLEVIIDITSGDDVDEDDLDDELERAGRGYVSYELEDEDTLRRSA